MAVKVSAACMRERTLSRCFSREGSLALSNQRLRFLAPFAGITEADFGIDPDGEQLLAPVDATFEPSELATRWRDQLGWSPSSVGTIRRLYVDQARTVVAMGARMQNLMQNQTG